MSSVLRNISKPKHHRYVLKSKRTMEIYEVLQVSFWVITIAKNEKGYRMPNPIVR